MPSYAQPTDMINCFRADVIGDVVSDDGQQVDPNSLLTDPTLLSALQRASGEFEAALMAGGIYLISDLTSLSDNAQALMVDIVCTIAMWNLLKRNPNANLELLKIIAEDAREKLKALRQGAAVFGNTSNAENGVLPETTGPTILTFQTLNMLRDNTRHYFPPRLFPQNLQ